MGRDGLLPKESPASTRRYPGDGSLAELFRPVCCWCSQHLRFSDRRGVHPLCGYLFIGFAALLVLRNANRISPVLIVPGLSLDPLLVLLVSATFLFGSIVGDFRHGMFTVILIVLSYAAAILMTRRNNGGSDSAAGEMIGT